MKQLSTLVCAFILITFSGCTNNEVNDKNGPKVTYEKANIKPYPDAVRVNLLVGDKADLKTIETKDLKNSTRPEGYDLSDAQRTKFEEAIVGVKIKNANDDTPTGYGVACFIPHHFFRYYDSSDNLVGEISICFCCYDYRASPQLESGLQVDYVDMDFEAMEELVAKMGIPTEIACE